MQGFGDTVKSHRLSIVKGEPCDVALSFVVATILSSSR